MSEINFGGDWREIVDTRIERDLAAKQWVWIGCTICGRPVVDGDCGTPHAAGSALMMIMTGPKPEGWQA